MLLPRPMPGGARSPCCRLAERERAADELRGLWPAVQDDPRCAGRCCWLPPGVGLSDCAAQLAAWSEAIDPGAGNELQFALPQLRPAGGFRVDPALVYALTRVELNFDPARDIRRWRSRADAAHAGDGTTMSAMIRRWTTRACTIRR